MATVYSAEFTEVQGGETSTFEWGNFEGPPFDGFGQLPTLDFREACVAIGYKGDDGRFHVCGSGTMIALGVILTATHVLDEMEGGAPLAWAYLPNGRLRLWVPVRRANYSITVESPLPTAPDQVETHDISLIACELISPPEIDFPIRIARASVDVPKLGARLWAVGHRRVNSIEQEMPEVALFASSGLVTEVYPSRRDKMLPNPCVEADMTTIGGMSGGPVYDERGHVVGVVSTSMQGAPDVQCRPTHVSMMWPAFLLDVGIGWPAHRWDSIAAQMMNTLVHAPKRGLSNIRGHAGRDPDGRWYYFVPDDLPTKAPE